MELILCLLSLRIPLHGQPERGMWGGASFIIGGIGSGRHNAASFFLLLAYKYIAVIGEMRMGYQ